MQRIFFNATTGPVLASSMLVMMMIAPNPLVRQKEGAQWEEEEEAGDRRKAGSIGNPKRGADAPIGPTWSGVSDARNEKKHGHWCGIPIHMRGRGG